MRQRSVVWSFAVYGFAAVCAVTLVVGLLVARQVRMLTISGAADVVASGASGIVTEDLEPGTTRLPSTLPIDEAVLKRTQTGNVYTFEVFRPDGTIVYSSETGVGAGEVIDHGALWDGALGGKVSFDVVPADSVPLLDEENGEALHVFAPVRAGDGTVIGVVEVYKPYAQIAASVDQSVAIAWRNVVGGALATYVLLFAVVFWSSGALARKEEEALSLSAQLDESLRDIETHTLGTLQALTAAVDAKDHYTARHSLGVCECAMILGRRLGLEGDELADLERAAMLHDVGKIGVPEAVLLKPERLTAAEFQYIWEHSAAGAHILETIPFLRRTVPAVRHHHERWDGKGYPDGLARTEIPRLARILAVADSFEAMTTDRPYRSARTLEEAVHEVEECAGTQFDPDVVSALSEAVDAADIPAGRHMATSA